MTILLCTMTILLSQSWQLFIVNDYVCCFMNLELNLAKWKINFKMLVIYLLELHFLWTRGVLPVILRFWALPILFAQQFFWSKLSSIRLCFRAIRVSHKHLSGGGEHLVQEVGGNQQLLGGTVIEQSVSAYVNIPTFTIALRTLASLSLTFSEEKGDTPS